VERVLESVKVKHHSLTRYKMRVTTSEKTQCSKLLRTMEETSHLFPNYDLAVNRRMTSFVLQ